MHKNANIEFILRFFETRSKFIRDQCQPKSNQSNENRLSIEGRVRGDSDSPNKTVK